MCATLFALEVASGASEAFSMKKGKWNPSMRVSSLGPATRPCRQTHPTLFPSWKAHAPSSTCWRPKFLSCDYMRVWRSFCIPLQGAFRAVPLSHETRRSFDSVPRISTPLLEEDEQGRSMVPSFVFPFKRTFDPGRCWVCVQWILL